MLDGFAYRQMAYNNARLIVKPDHSFKLLAEYALYNYIVESKNKANILCCLPIVFIWMEAFNVFFNLTSFHTKYMYTVQIRKMYFLASFYLRYRWQESEIPLLHA